MGVVNNFFSKKRSWSLIKDQLLDSYLTPYMAKIVTSRKPLAIIDCFAGKGRFDYDLTPGSPLIIAEHIKNYSNHNIIGYFIEKKYVSDLRANLNGYDKCKIYAGTFEENLEHISETLTPYHNVFVYVDPYGIKSLDFNRFQKLKSRNFSTLELLLNFNSFGFLREGCRLLTYEDLFHDDDDYDDYNYEIDEANSVKHMNEIANGEYWKSILRDFKAGKINMYQAEEEFTKIYIKQLKNLFKYIINIPIKTKEKNIPKYRLVFGTNHPDGLILMADNMNKKWNKIIETENGGQINLFSEYYSPEVSFKNKIEKDLDVNKKVIQILSKTDRPMPLKELIVQLILTFGITFSESSYKLQIKEMNKSGLLNIETFPKITKTGKQVTSLNYVKYKIFVSIN